MARLRLTAQAQADIVDILDWTRQQFGDVAQDRYEQLLSRALEGLVEDPVRRGSASRLDLGQAIRVYHLRHSKGDIGVAHPRHLIVYQLEQDDMVKVVRILHDAMDLERHIQLDIVPKA